jgi:hypothetical protein
VASGFTPPRWPFGWASLALALLGLIVLVMMGFAYRALVLSAESYVTSLGHRSWAITGTRVPCSGILSVGVVVRYKLPPDRTEEYVGRACHDLKGWSWMPDANQR